MNVESPDIRISPTIADTVATDTKCSVRIITTNDEFDTLEGDWNALLDQSPSTIFQTFEWIRTWWKYNATSNDQLHILLFSSGNRLIGIGPLYKEEKKVFGQRLMTRLQCIAHGLSDYVDFIILPGFEKIVLNAFAEHLKVNAKVWDVFDIEDVNEHSPLVHMLSINHGNLRYESVSLPGKRITKTQLPATAEMLSDNLRSSTRATFRRKVKKLQSGFTLEMITYKNETDDIQAGIEAFAYIHGQRWKSLGYPSAFDGEALRAYHIEVSKKFARRGWLRLFLLKINDLPIAVIYNFNYNGCIYMYHNNAFGPDEMMKYSPGMYIRSVAMTEGITEGMRVFDYLRGNEAYKYSEWPVTETKNYLIRASSPVFINRLRFTIFLAAELLMKSAGRIRRERYEYRKYTITKRPTLPQKFSYAGSKSIDLFVLGYNFLVRHIPFSIIQRLQIEKISPQDTDAQRGEVSSRNNKDDSQISA